MGRKKILIVDDEKDIVRALMTRFQAAGYDVAAAFDGAQGIFMAHKEKPDLIVLDIRMPAGDGFRTAERLKRSTHTWGIPVIFLTGSPLKEAESRAIEIGARSFIKKPYDPEKLLEIVKKILDEASAGSSLSTHHESASWSMIPE